MILAHVPPVTQWGNQTIFKKTVEPQRQYNRGQSGARERSYLRSARSPIVVRHRPLKRILRALLSTPKPNAFSRRDSQRQIESVHIHHIEDYDLSCAIVLNQVQYFIEHPIQYMYQPHFLYYVATIHRIYKQYQTSIDNRFWTTLSHGEQYEKLSWRSIMLTQNHAFKSGWIF